MTVRTLRCRGSSAHRGAFRSISLGAPTLLLAAIELLLAACGGGSSPAPPPPPPPPPSSDTLVRVSATSPFASNCDGVPANGTVYVNGEVEPSLSVNPLNPANLVGAWQEDRWSTGGAHGVLVGASSDGGKTWTRMMVPFSRCSGGNAGNGGDYERASDPWVSFSPSGTAYAMALVFSGISFAPGSSSGMRVAHSSDGGATWSAPQNLIADGANFLNDKGSITADPTDGNLVYAVWDRLTNDQHSVSELARSTDGGVTWEAPRAIYDPGASNQTIGNVVVVLPNGTVVSVFSEIDVPANAAQQSSLRAVRSTDHGVTWSAPLKIADEFPVATTTPNTGAPVRDSGVLGSVAQDRSGTLYITWEDSRFSNGARNGVAISRSTDGALTWSAPVQINADTATQAFVPTAQVRSDGVIAVTYYDFRNATVSGQTLPTDYWMVTSTDATHWTESHVSGSFDLDIAPQDSGLFLGDYQSLASSGSTFLPFFAQTNNGNISNPSDIFVAFSEPSGQAAQAPSAAAHTVTPRAAEPVVMTAAWQRRLDENLARIRRSRLLGRPR